MHITVWRQHQFVGYIKSVGYKNGTYSVTQDIRHAKTYKTEIAIMQDIDFCSKVAKEFLVFTYQ